jgi:GTP-binding protein HflX
LFATLDARVARARSGKLRDIVFVDTVGFVRKLPTTLVATFRSTLSEIRDADLVLHVLDTSSPRVDEERRIAAEVLDELGVDPEKVVSVWNKQDLLPGRGSSPFGISVSAKTGEGIERLEAEIQRRAHPEKSVFSLRIPYSRGAEIAAARARFRVIEEKSDEKAITLHVAGDAGKLDNLSPFLFREKRPPPARRRRRPQTEKKTNP